MLCAHTVRRLKPGTFDEFAEAFRPGEVEPPAGWVRFTMLRGQDDPDQVVTFGFFDGTREALESSQVDHGYRDRLEAVAPLVDEVVVNGLYDVVVEMKAEGAKA